jgi:hypothetical protein
MRSWKSWQGSERVPRRCSSGVRSEKERRASLASTRKPCRTGKRTRRKQTRLSSHLSEQVRRVAHQLRPCFHHHKLCRLFPMCLRPIPSLVRRFPSHLVPTRRSPHLRPPPRSLGIPFLLLQLSSCPFSALHFAKYRPRLLRVRLKIPWPRRANVHLRLPLVLLYDSHSLRLFRFKLITRQRPMYAAEPSLHRPSQILSP